VKTINKLSPMSLYHRFDREQKNDETTTTPSIKTTDEVIDGFNEEFTVKIPKGAIFINPMLGCRYQITTDRGYDILIVFDKPMKVKKINFEDL
jgi:hypothetical protein